MASVQLSELRDRILFHVDAEHESNDGPWVSDSRLNAYINWSRRRLDAYLARYDLQQDESSVDVTADGSTNYDLATAGATDYVALLGVYYIDNNGDPVWIPRHGGRERPSSTGNNRYARSYRVYGKKLELDPIVSEGTYRVYYVPEASPLSSDSDTVDYPFGWEEWIVLQVAMKLRQKEESVDDPLKRDFLELKAEIANETVIRDTYEVQSIADVDEFKNNTGRAYGRPFSWPYY